MAYIESKLEELGLSILASLRHELGDLDRVTAWLKVLGMAQLPFDIPVEIEGEVEIRT
jgi:hypothetical protein